MRSVLQIITISNQIALVEFYGDHKIAHLSLKNIVPFAAHETKSSKRKLFNTAMTEAQNDVSSQLKVQSFVKNSEMAKLKALRVEMEAMERETEAEMSCIEIM